MDPHDRALWARVLAVDETSHEYFAQRQDLPGAILFTCAPSPEFNLALLQQTTTAKADRLLDDVIAHYTRLGAATRVRLTPLSAPADWPDRLAARGFLPLPDEDELFLVLTGTHAAGLAAGLPANPEVTVRRVSRETAETDAAVFTRVQRAGFGMGEEGLSQGIQATRNGPGGRPLPLLPGLRGRRARRPRPAPAWRPTAREGLPGSTALPPCPGPGARALAGRWCATW